VLSLSLMEQTIINKTERPNSYEFGKAGNRFKLYFEDAWDLKQQLKNLEEAGIKEKEGGEQNDNGKD